MTFLFAIYISGSLFSAFRLKSRKNVNSVSMYTKMSELDLSVMSKFLLLEIVSIFVGTGSVLNCWQLLNCTSAYALNFVNCRFGSLLWLQRIPISMLAGPYKFCPQCVTYDHNLVCAVLLQSMLVSSNPVLIQFMLDITIDAILS